MFWADVALVDTKERTERGLYITYKAKSAHQAVEDAVRFARDREKNLDLEFAALKVGSYQPAPIEPDGSYIPPGGGGFFEWKWDWPGTLQERIESLRKRERRVLTKR